MEQLTFTPAEVMAKCPGLFLSERTLRREMVAGRIEHINNRGHRVMTQAQIDKMLAQLTKAPVQRDHLRAVPTDEHTLEQRDADRAARRTSRWAS